MKKNCFVSIVFKIKKHDKITIYRVQIKIKNRQRLHNITQRVRYVNNALKHSSF